MADNLKLAMQIVVDMADAKGKISSFQSDMKSLGTTAAGSASQTKGAAKALDELSVSASTAGFAQSKASKGLKSISEELDFAKKATLVFIAVQQGIRLASGIADTADAYKNLSSRIKLAAGDGAAFQAAMAGVQSIAKETSSNLQNTGNLFARLAEAGKQMGVGNEEALSLTKTINQAVQLSGAGAQESSAAIRQFIQALQSGVLRGDEFNSIMEQAPRLSKAFADGLGVPVSALRAMAEAGELSAERLLLALSSQKEVIDKAFASLPDTVGRAVENMNTAWTIFLGGLDQSTGASSSAAHAIQFLSDHLDDIASIGFAVAIGATAKFTASLIGSGAAAFNTAYANAAYALSMVGTEKAALAAAQAENAAALAALNQHRALATLTPNLNAVAAAEARAATAATALAAAETRAAASAGLLASAGRGVLALTGGIPGLIALLATTAASFFLMRDSAQAADSVLAEMGTTTDAVKDKFNQMTKAIQNAELEKLKQAAAEASAANQTLIRNLGQLASKLDDQKEIYDQIRNAMSMTATGGVADWGRISDAVKNNGNINDKTKSTLINLIGEIQQGSDKTATLEDRLTQLSRAAKSAEGSLDGVKRVLDATNTQAYAEEINQLAIKLADLNDPEGAIERRVQRDFSGLSEELKAGIVAYHNAIKAGEEKQKKPKKERSGRAPKEDKSYLNEEKKFTDALAKAQLELKNAQNGVLEGTTKNRDELNLWLQSAENAKNLTNQEVIALKNHAEAADAAAMALLRFNEAKANDKTNAGLQLDLLKLEGKPLEAALAEIQAKFDELRRDFEEKGNAAGITLIESMLPLQKAKARLDEVQRDISEAIQKQNQSETSIQTQVDTGAESELFARQKLLDVHKQTATVLTQLKPTLIELSEMPGAVGDQAKAMLVDLDNKVRVLSSTTSLFETTLRQGLTSGLNEAIRGLANGTLDLKAAIVALSQSVVNALADQAAQFLAQEAAKSLTGLFGGASDGAGATAGAAATSVAAVELSVAGGVVLTAAQAMSLAATQLAAAGAAGAAGGAGGFLSSATSIFGFAKGGYTGAGAKYEPAGVVHAGEFVTRREILNEPGALPFLTAFNKNGMQAIEAFLGRGYADGGFVGMPEFKAPAFQLSLPDQQKEAAAETRVNNHVSLNLIDDPDRIASLLKTPQGEAAFTVLLSKNPAKFRQALGI